MEDGKRVSASDTDRLKINGPFLEKASSQLKLNGISHGALSFDPFDQLMRQQLLASEMESFFSRFTPALAGGARETENKSLLLDAHTLDELKILVDERMAYHNRERRHSTIGYSAPKTYVTTPWLRLYHNSDAQRVSKIWGAPPHST